MTKRWWASILGALTVVTGGVVVHAWTRAPHERSVSKAASALPFPKVTRNTRTAPKPATATTSSTSRPALLHQARGSLPLTFSYFTKTSQSLLTLPKDFPFDINPVSFFEPSEFRTVWAFRYQWNQTTGIMQWWSGPHQVAAVMTIDGRTVFAQAWSSAVTVRGPWHNTIVVKPDTGPSAHWVSVNLATGQVSASQAPPANDSLLGGTVAPTVLPSQTEQASVWLTIANRLLNTTVSPQQVLISQTGSTVTVTRKTLGRWQTVTFRRASYGWVPTTVTANVDGLHLTYTVTMQTNLLQPPQDTAFSVTLSAPEMATLAHRVSQQPYSPKDTQVGALARLPINLLGYRSQAPGQAKIVLSRHSQEILALTYVTHSQGRPAFLPIGWYWWKGGPSVVALAHTLPACRILPPAQDHSVHAVSLRAQCEDAAAGWFDLKAPQQDAVVRPGQHLAIQGVVTDAQIWNQPVSWMILAGDHKVSSTLLQGTTTVSAHGRLTLTVPLPTHWPTLNGPAITVVLEPPAGQGAPVTVVLRALDVPLAH